MLTSTTSVIARAQRQAWNGRTIGILVLIAAAIGFYLAATYHTTVIKKEAPVSMLMPVEAPPPPPPPPPKENTPQETEQSIQQPIAPTQQATHDNAITQNAEAQIGGDAYGIGSGSGEGMRGGGIAGMLNRGPYAAYMAQEIRQAASRNNALRGKSFKIGISLWLTPAGKIAKAELRSSTGSDEIDRELKSLLATMAPFAQAPPQSILDSLPVNMTIDFRQTL